LVKGIGKDYDWTFIKENLKEGDVFSAADTGCRSIVISRYLANKLELKLNDKMVIYFLSRKVEGETESFEQRVKTFSISGIYETGLEELDQKLVLVDLNLLKKVNYWEDDQIGGYEISINDYKQVNVIADDVNDLIGQGLVTRTIRELQPNIFSWLDLQDINAIIVVVLMLLVAGINMISALLILILERTNMIGILKALGASNGNIQRIFLYNGGYLILRGLLWGNLLGIGLALFQHYTGFFTLDQATYYVSVVPVKIDPVMILLLNAGTLVCCMIMLLLPGFMISRITPVKAIRFS
jgi:lipoprotein-releasing system permease protein